MENLTLLFCWASRSCGDGELAARDNMAPCILPQFLFQRYASTLAEWFVGHLPQSCLQRWSSTWAGHLNLSWPTRFSIHPAERIRISRAEDILGNPELLSGELIFRRGYRILRRHRNLKWDVPKSNEEWTEWKFIAKYFPTHFICIVVVKLDFQLDFMSLISCRITTRICFLIWAFFFSIMCSICNLKCEMEMMKLNYFVNCVWFFHDWKWWFQFPIFRAISLPSSSGCLVAVSASRLTLVLLALAGFHSFFPFPDPLLALVPGLLFAFRPWNGKWIEALVFIVERWPGKWCIVYIRK